MSRPRLTPPLLSLALAVCLPLAAPSAQTDPQEIIDAFDQAQSMFPDPVVVWDKAIALVEITNDDAAFSATLDTLDAVGGGALGSLWQTGGTALVGQVPFLPTLFGVDGVNVLGAANLSELALYPFDISGLPPTAGPAPAGAFTGFVYTGRIGVGPLHVGLLWSVDQFALGDPEAVPPATWTFQHWMPWRRLDDPSLPVTPAEVGDYCARLLNGDFDDPQVWVDWFTTLPGAPDVPRHPARGSGYSDVYDCLDNAWFGYLNTIAAIDATLSNDLYNKALEGSATWDQMMDATVIGGQDGADSGVSGSMLAKTLGAALGMAGTAIAAGMAAAASPGLADHIELIQDEMQQLRDNAAQQRCNAAQNAIEAACACVENELSPEEKEQYQQALEGWAASQPGC